MARAMNGSFIFCCRPQAALVKIQAANACGFALPSAAGRLSKAASISPDCGHAEFFWIDLSSFSESSFSELKKCRYNARLFRQTLKTRNGAPLATMTLRAFVSRRVVTPEGVRPAAILVEGERVREVVAPEVVPTQADSRDFGEVAILPGLVDSHVHINDPGRADWEGFETAGRAAAAGGYTLLVDMPLN